MHPSSGKRSFSTSNLFDTGATASVLNTTAGNLGHNATTGLSSDARMAQLQLEVSRLQREASLRQSSEEMKLSNLEERHRRALKRLEAEHEARLAVLKGSRLEQELADRNAQADERTLKLEAQCQQLKLSLKAADRQLSRASLSQSAHSARSKAAIPYNKTSPPRHGISSDSQHAQPSHGQSRRPNSKRFASPQKNACCETLRLELHDGELVLSELRQKHAEKVAECDSAQSKLSEVRAHVRESARAHEVAQAESHQEIKTLNEEVARLKEYLTVAEARLDAQAEKNRVLKHTIDTRLEALQNQFSEKIVTLEQELDRACGEKQKQEDFVAQLRQQLCVYWELIVSLQGKLGDVVQSANRGNFDSTSGAVDSAAPEQQTIPATASV